MYPIKIISIGKLKNDNLSQEIDSILKRVPRVEHIILKEQKGSTVSEIKEKEFLLFERYFKSESYVIILTEKGVSFSSENFYEKISKIEKRLIFLISGPFGPSEKLLSKADLLLSLSKMTFTHEQALYMLTEQIYRSYCFEIGKEYTK